MGFWKLFRQSLGEYGGNFKAIFWFMFYFFFIPSAVISVIAIAFIYFLGQPIDLSYGGKFILGVILLAILGTIAKIVIFSFVNGGIVLSTIKKKKFSFSDLVKNAKKIFSAMILFQIAVLVLAALLAVPLVIPGIIFMVYWCFGIYIRFSENKSTWQSLLRSQEIVRGSWWKVVGYTILFVVVVGVGLTAISIPQMILDSMKMFSILEGTEKISMNYYALKIVVATITSFLTNLVYYPLCAIFFKNFYLDMKARRSKSDEKYIKKISRRNKIIITLTGILCVLFSAIMAILIIGTS